MVMFDFLQSLSLETRELYYSNIGTAIRYAALIGNILYGKKVGLSWIKSLLFTAIIQVLVFETVSYYARELELLLFNRGNFASFRSILLVPLVAIPLSKFTKTDFSLICDYSAPIFFLRHGLVTIACIFTGCCGGKEWSWGFISPETGAVYFPLQLFIIFFGSLVGVFCFWYNKKKNYRAGTATFSYGIIFYGIFRFAAEFISDSNRLFWGLSLYSLYSLLMVIVGALMLRRAKRTAERARQPHDI